MTSVSKERKVPPGYVAVKVCCGGMVRPQVYIENKNAIRSEEFNFAGVSIGAAVLWWIYSMLLSLHIACGFPWAREHPRGYQWNWWSFIYILIILHQVNERSYQRNTLWFGQQIADNINPKCAGLPGSRVWTPWSFRLWQHWANIRNFRELKFIRRQRYESIGKQNGRVLWVDRSIVLGVLRYPSRWEQKNIVEKWFWLKFGDFTIY